MRPPANKSASMTCHEEKAREEEYTNSLAFSLSAPSSSVWIQSGKDSGFVEATVLERQSDQDQARVLLPDQTV
jgi:hypothetical protein